MTRTHPAHPLKKLLLIAGRYRVENPYLELVVKHRLESAGVEVTFGLPTRTIQAACFPEEMRDDPVFRREGAIFVDSVASFTRAMRGSQVVLFSSWKGYAELEQQAARLGRLTMDFSAAAGLDHYGVGRDLCLVKSPVMRAMMLDNPAFWWCNPQPPKQNIRSVGSILYEDPEQLLSQQGMQDRDRFCAYYDLDPARPIAVLFPKGIIGFRKKIRLWFKEWDEAEVDRFNQWFLDHYLAMAQATLAGGCNFLVKLHPSSYASYWCKDEEEYAFWGQHPWIRILEPRHTLAMFHHLDAGLGISTHAAMDTAYFGKPFIYVDSDLAPPPPIFGLHARSYPVSLPLGPSSHWHTPPTEYPNPWFPTWLGHFARLSELSGMLADPNTYRVDAHQQQRFIAEFWHRNDDRASDAIVAQVLEVSARRLADKRFWNDSTVRQGIWQEWRDTWIDLGRACLGDRHHPGREGGKSR